MALPNYTIELSIRDGEGKMGNLTFYHDTNIHADAVTAANGIATAVAALTDGVVAKVTLTQTVSTNAAAAPADTDVEIKGLFTFNNADGKAYQVSVPAFVRTYMLPNSDQIDLTQPAVLNFTADVISEGYVDSRAVDIVAVRSAVEQFTRRRTR